MTLKEEFQLECKDCEFNNSLCLEDDCYKEFLEKLVIELRKKLNQE